MEANTVKYVEARDVEILTAPEAATYLKVRPSWLYEAARARRVPHLRIGRHLRFLRSDLDAWLREQRVPTRP